MENIFPREIPKLLNLKCVISARLAALNELHSLHNWNLFDLPLWSTKQCVFGAELKDWAGVFETCFKTALLVFAVLFDDDNGTKIIYRFAWFEVFYDRRNPLKSLHYIWANLRPNHGLI